MSLMLNEPFGNSVGVLVYTVVVLDAVLCAAGNAQPEPDYVVYFPIRNGAGVVEFHPQRPSQTKVFYNPFRERGIQSTTVSSSGVLQKLVAHTGNVSKIVPSKQVETNTNVTYNILEVTPQELACFKQHLVYVSGHCYKLASVGPCESKEWLVLDKKSLAAGRINPTCVPKQCKSGYHMWAKTNRCYLITDAVKYGLCSKGHELGVNVFGEAVCTCKVFPPHISSWKGKDNSSSSNNDTNPVCYPVRHRGPCPFPEILTPGGCIHNPCIEDGYDFNKNDSECYKLGEPGPCSGSLIFQVDPVSLMPSCITPLPNRHLVRVPMNCMTDAIGNCRKEFTVRAKHKENEFTLDAFEDF